MGSKNGNFYFEPPCTVIVICNYFFFGFDVEGQGKRKLIKKLIIIFQHNKILVLLYTLFIDLSSLIG